MNVKCSYADALRCSECNHVYFSTCKKFVVAHAKFLASDILPFKSKRVSLKSKVVWSRDCDLAKSAALRYALKTNGKIMHLTLSQVISLTLQSAFPDVTVVYVEASSSSAGDLEKVKGVLKSFVDAMQLQDTYVSIYVAPLCKMILDYEKL